MDERETAGWGKGTMAIGGTGLTFHIPTKGALGGWQQGLSLQQEPLFWQSCPHLELSYNINILFRLVRPDYLSGHSVICVCLLLSFINWFYRQLCIFNLWTCFYCIANSLVSGSQIWLMWLFLCSCWNQKNLKPIPLRKMLEKVPLGGQWEAYPVQKRDHRKQGQVADEASRNICIVWQICVSLWNLPSC